MLKTLGTGHHCGDVWRKRFSLGCGLGFGFGCGSHLSQKLDRRPGGGSVMVPVVLAAQNGHFLPQPPRKDGFMSGNGYPKGSFCQG